MSQEVTEKLDENNSYKKVKKSLFSMARKADYEWFNAVEDFSFKVLESAVNEGFDFNKDGETPLTIAASANNLDFIEWLLSIDQGVSKYFISARNEKGETAFLCAVTNSSFSSFEVAQLLYKYGCGLQDMDCELNNALILALIRRNRSSEQARLQKGLPPPDRMVPWLLSEPTFLENNFAIRPNAYGVSAYDLACAIGDESLINRLSQYGNPEKAALTKESFDFSIKYKTFKLLERLVASADMKSTFYEGSDTFLHAAVKAKSLEAVDIVLSKEPSLICFENEKHKLPMHLAFEELWQYLTWLNYNRRAAHNFDKDKKANMVRLMFKKALDQVISTYQKRDAEDNNLLHMAMLLGMDEAVEKILDECYELLNQANRYGTTPMQMVVGSYKTAFKKIISIDAERNKSEKIKLASDIKQAKQDLMTVLGGEYPHCAEDADMGTQMADLLQVVSQLKLKKQQELDDIAHKREAEQKQEMTFEKACEDMVRSVSVKGNRYIFQIESTSDVSLNNNATVQQGMN